MNILAIFSSSLLLVVPHYLLKELNWPETFVPQSATPTVGGLLWRKYLSASSGMSLNLSCRSRSGNDL